MYALCIMYVLCFIPLCIMLPTWIMHVWYVSLPAYIMSLCLCVVYVMYSLWITYLSIIYLSIIYLSLCPICIAYVLCVMCVLYTYVLCTWGYYIPLGILYFHRLWRQVTAVLHREQPVAQRIEMLKWGLLNFIALCCLQKTIVCTLTAEIKSNSPYCQLTKYNFRQPYMGIWWLSSWLWIFTCTVLTLISKGF